MYSYLTEHQSLSIKILSNVQLFPSRLTVISVFLKYFYKLRTRKLASMVCIENLWLSIYQLPLLEDLGRTRYRKYLRYLMPAHIFEVASKLS